MSEPLLNVSLSNSSIDRFISCPYSFFMAYIRRMENGKRFPKKGVTEFYGHYGSLVHLMAEMYPRTNHYGDLPWEPDVVREGRDKDNVDSVLKVYGNDIMTKFREDGTKLTLERMLEIFDEVMPLIDFPSEEKREEYHEQGVDFINRIPDMDWSHVIGLEAAFKFKLFENMPELKGFIDMVERDEKGLIVTDYKSSKPYSANASLKKNQLPFYGIACYFMYGELPYKYRYHFTRHNKIVEIEVPTERLTQLKQAIQYYYMQMVAYNNAGKFPQTYQDFYCKNFCGYGYECDAFKRFNVVADTEEQKKKIEDGLKRFSCF